MFVSGLVLSAAMALTASAVPLASNHAHLHAERHLHARQSQASTFTLNIINNCPSTKQFAIYQITEAFAMNQVSATTTIDSGSSATIQAPFQETGLRLSGNADWSNQWLPQALFEFGYTPSYSGSNDGTAYDISIMPGSDPSIGIHAHVIPNGSGSTACESKTCLPWDCPLSQGWTNEDQVDDGSPADTVCYAGPSAMNVVWCPSQQPSAS